MNARTSGLAQVELLAIVSVLSLAGLLVLPAMQQIRMHQPAATCLANMRVQGVAHGMYMSDHAGWFPSGIMSNNPPEPGGAPSPYIEWGSTHLAYLPYLGYAGEFGSLFQLWSFSQNDLALAYASISAYQCPQHPDPNSELDYVSNAIPLPFSRLNLETDNWRPGAEPCAGVGVGSVWYYGMRNYSDLAATVDPSKYVYITEGHACLAPTFGNNFRFNAFFTSGHIPFAGSPRIADDPRHPYGLGNLFFDGHARGLDLNDLDPGWPYPHIDRLRYYSPSDMTLCGSPPRVVGD